MKLHLRSVPFAAVCLATVALFGATWKTVALWHSRAPGQGMPAPASEGNPPALDASQGPNASSAAAARMTRRQMHVAMAEDQASLDRDQAAIRSLCARLGIQPDEDIVSLGRYEELAAEGLKFVALLTKFNQAMGAGKTAELNEQEFMTASTAWVAKSETIGRLEDSPAKIARLFTSAVQASLPLEAPQAQAVQAAIREEFEKLKAAGLTRSHRPEENYKDWYAARAGALKEAAARIESVLPAGQRQPYLVEQILHLGTGMKTHTSYDETTQRGSLSLSYDLPGMSPYRF